MQTSPALDPARPHINVAVLGHSGHGKSRLVAALTARSFVHASRPWAKTTNRIVFVDLAAMPVRGEVVRHSRASAIEFESPFRHYSALDVPGARRLCDAALAACSAADVAVLVVSATEGALSQTREHALFARALGVPSIVVFLSHCDRVSDAAQLDLAENEVREVLSDVGYSGDMAPFVRGASIEDDASPWAATLDDLLAAIDREVRDPARDTAGRARATVLWRYETLRQPDSIALVYVSRGTIRRGDKLLLLGRRDPVSVAVTGTRVFDRPVESVAAGDIATLRLSAQGAPVLWRRALHRGAALEARAASSPKVSALVSLRLLTAGEGGRHTEIVSGYRGALCFGATKVATRFVLPPRTDRVRPGESLSGVIAELQWSPSVELPARFVLRDGCDGFQRKFGGGARWSGTSAIGTLDEWRTPDPTT